MTLPKTDLIEGLFVMLSMAAFLFGLKSLIAFLWRRLFEKHRKTQPKLPASRTIDWRDLLK